MLFLDFLEEKVSRLHEQGIVPEIPQVGARFLALECVYPYPGSGKLLCDSFVPALRRGRVAGDVFKGPGGQPQLFRLDSPPVAAEDGSIGGRAPFDLRGNLTGRLSPLQCALRRSGGS